MELIGRQPYRALCEGEQVRSALAEGVSGQTLVPAQLFSRFGVVAVVGITHEACVVQVRVACKAGPDSKADDDRHCGQQNEESGNQPCLSNGWYEGSS